MSYCSILALVLLSCATCLPLLAKANVHSPSFAFSLAKALVDPKSFILSTSGSQAPHFEGQPSSAGITTKFSDAFEKDLYPGGAVFLTSPRNGKSQEVILKFTVKAKVRKGLLCWEGWVLRKGAQEQRWR
jgi:hypothetical protein